MKKPIVPFGLPSPLCGCGYREVSEDDWLSIEKGMSRDEVLFILGDPIAEGRDDTGTTLNYKMNGAIWYVAISPGPHGSVDFKARHRDYLQEFYSEFGIDSLNYRKESKKD